MRASRRRFSQWLYAFRSSYVADVSAYLIALPTGGAFGLFAFPMCVGGFVGGLGVALSFGIVHRELRSPKRLLGVAGVAALAAVPFGAWLGMLIPRLNVPQDPGQPLRLMYSFAVWQAARRDVPLLTLR